MLSSKRLAKISEFIKSDDFVADIGADHGKLIIEIANKYPNNKYLAVENKKGPFNNLKKNVESYNFNKNIECSLSDGISYLPDYVNTLVFSGMGGQNVIDIVSNNFERFKKIRKIVFCVNSLGYKLQSFLYHNGFAFIKDEIVVDANHKYRVVCVKYYQKYDLNLFLSDRKKYKNELEEIGIKVFPKYDFNTFFEFQISVINYRTLNYRQKEDLSNEF